jgi:hypothetical protein
MSALRLRPPHLAGLIILAAIPLAWAAAALRSRARVHEHYTEERVSRERPVPVPEHLSWRDEALQLTADGDGPLFHRRYRLDIDRPRRSTEELMAHMQRDLNAFEPKNHAHFTKTEGGPGKMAVGDRFDITIAGPWNGSVRVVEVGPRSFSLVTLRGHPEAGQIRFRLTPHPQRKGSLRFEIMSWARSRDMLVGLAFSAAGKEIQKNAWAEFCLNVAEQSGGAASGEVSVLTEERPFEEEVVGRA